MRVERSLIVAAAPAEGANETYAAIITSAPHVIAADAGLHVCLLAGRMPDICVGDFDSVSGPDLARATEAGVTIRRFPAEKDESDLDLAVQVARELGVTSLQFTACFGDRFDHSVASLGTFIRCADLSPQVIDPIADLYVLDPAGRPSIELALEPGSVVSFFAACGDAVLSASGVRYPLQSAEVGFFSSLGLSNVAEAPLQRFSVERGTALVVISHRAERAVPREG